MCRAGPAAAPEQRAPPQIDRVPIAIFLRGRFERARMLHLQGKEVCGGLAGSEHRTNLTAAVRLRMPLIKKA